jgi:hypothetical protein
MTSAALARPGSSTDSRHTMASLLRLRRWLWAEAFRRRYTSSGMVFRVSVVGMTISDSIGTNMVPFRISIKNLTAPSLDRISG